MDIRLPKLGEGSDTGTVVTVMVKEGDPVRKDQPLIEIESEKAVATIPSPEAGTVQKLHVQPGQTITVGQLILSLSGGASAEARTSAPTVEAPAVTAAPAATVPAPTARPVVDVSGVSLEAIPDSVAMPAAPPSVRFMAAQLGLDLRRISSLTGRQRVGVDDLRHYVETLQKLAAKADQPSVPPAETKPVAESIDLSQWGPVLKQPLTQLRKVIGRRMTATWQAIPHVTQFDEVDMTTILH
ncbi:MAG: biotin/lipoyl-containing protein, partial [Verrucomicrobiales bacterium]